MKPVFPSASAVASFCLFEYIIINLRAIESNNFLESYMSVIVRNQLCGYEFQFRLLYM
jgi:hypothetical protein